MSIRSVEKIINCTKTFEGEGFPVQRPFPTEELMMLDPFLLLDEMGPVDTKPYEAKGAPDHPHRGFETVTIMFSGAMVHKDSAGQVGRLEAGGVQWMTAGAGVVHSEMPSEELLASGGRFHGVQLWVNLPKQDKMTKPRYQDIPPHQVSVAKSEDGLVSARIIAGEALGVHAPTETRTPITYLDLTIQPGGKIVQPVSPSFNAFAYIIDGEGLFGKERTKAGDGQMAIFAQDGDEVVITVPEDVTLPLHVLFLAGKPLNETVARYGPFVMNTEEEIYEAIEDYRSGRLGEINSEGL